MSDPLTTECGYCWSKTCTARHTMPLERELPRFPVPRRYAELHDAATARGYHLELVATVVAERDREGQPTRRFLNGVRLNRKMDHPMFETVKDGDLAKPCERLLHRLGHDLPEPMDA
jgi:hypothetical protein